MLTEWEIKLFNSINEGVWSDKILIAQVPINRKKFSTKLSREFGMPITVGDIVNSLQVEPSRVEIDFFATAKGENTILVTTLNIGSINKKPYDDKIDIYVYPAYIKQARKKITAPILLERITGAIEKSIKEILKKLKFTDTPIFESAFLEKDGNIFITVRDNEYGTYYVIRSRVVIDFDQKKWLLRVFLTDHTIYDVETSD